MPGPASPKGRLLAAAAKLFREKGYSRTTVRALISNELMFIHGKTRDAVAVLVFEWRALSPEKQALILKDRETFDKLWLETLEEARHSGLTVVESDVLRHLIHGAIAWSLYWYDEQGQLTMEELIDRTLTLAIKG